MGGPCLSGGGTFEECLLEVERMDRVDRYDTLEGIREHPLYKDTFIIEETDKNKGTRTTQINLYGAIVREEKYDIHGRRL